VFVIKNVRIGEEIVIVTDNRIGILADISRIMSESGINIEAAVGYEFDGKARLLLVTSANLIMIDALRQQGYGSVKETEVVEVDLENKPGAIKVVTTELANNGIDIHYIYVTSGPQGSASRMILETSDNEKTIALLQKYI
jgi:hypothetical protein